MSEESKNREGKSGKEFSDKADDLIGKSKDLADKAEDYLEETVEKVKRSDAFGKISGLFDKVENFMEEKSEEFHSGEMGAKFETLKDKAEDQAGEILKKVREAGSKIDESIESFKRKKGQVKNENGGGI
jgi:ElaB/YqjD/DUF883 family membrane-anchored ribosome-binding protein